MAATLGIADPSITPLIEDRIAASPDSVVPYIASGTHMYSLAFEARGAKAASNTTRDQFAGLQHFVLVKRREFDMVIRYWGAYLARRPNDGRGYLQRAGTNRAKGDMAAAQADIVTACELKDAQACGIAKSQGWQ